MHRDFDLNLTHLTKIEGAASVELRVRNNKVEHVYFKTTEYKRFFTQGMIGKPYVVLPQYLARICGTCSNAHILCSIKACENALDIIPSEQTMVLRDLVMDGMIIRDHALHLYLFVLPDLFSKDSFLDFDDSDHLQHQLLHDGFDIKAAGSYLSEIVAGRIVHGVFPVIGGFVGFPKKQEIKQAILKLEKIRPAVLRLIKVFEDCDFKFDRQTNFVALTPSEYGFLRGKILTGKGRYIEEKNFRDYFEKTILPYSQAAAFKHEGSPYLVGALARMNFAKDNLGPETKKSLGKTLSSFPSTNVFYNNLAQAIEILHCLDHAVNVLKTVKIADEKPVDAKLKQSTGIGIIEAPRGTLYHEVILGNQGKVLGGEVVVPTQQNQLSIERDIAALVETFLPQASQEKILFEMEKLVRAYDPCMSCAAHFLKVKWL